MFVYNKWKKDGEPPDAKPSIDSESPGEEPEDGNGGAEEA
jgi:hypothetical protein